MTQQRNIARNAHRRATALLLAAVAFPATVYAQETVTPPTVMVPVQPAPAPAPVQPPRVPAPVAQTPPSAPGESRTTIAPGVQEQAQQEARERAAARQAELRRERAAQAQRQPAAPPRAAAPTPDAAPPAAEPIAPAPVAEAPVTESAPVEAAAPPVAEAPAPVTDTATAPTADGGSNTLWLIMAGLGAVAALIAGIVLLRRRRDDEPVHARETVYAAEPESVVVPVREEPSVAHRATPVADPVAAAPIFVGRDAVSEPLRPATPVAAEIDGAPHAELQNVEMVHPDAADIDAVLGGARPDGNRPQLELAMRPTRAGMSRRGAMVEFELTVANAGGVPAEDVRIGAFMLGDNAAAPSEIERMLIDPPADLVVDAERIEPGDGTRLDAAVTLPRELVDAVAGEGEHGFTPVLVADARYRLPDGREGRTAAAFTIGRTNGGEHLEPIALQDDPAIYADIEARLHSVAAKV